jgi:NAD(P)-dependent dehydrogenase (short-subunit alcohol dehydrogenase family)
MKTRLENQIAIVTGSSSGNGRAIALALSSSGANAGSNGSFQGQRFKPAK